MHVSSYQYHTIKNEICITDLVTIHYFEYGKDYKYSGESHDFWELMYADRGNVIVTCDSTDYPLSSGEVILLPPNCFHKLEADNTTPSNVFIISFLAENTFLPMLEGRPLHLNSNLKSLIHSILHEGESTFVLPMTKIDRKQLYLQVNPMFGGEQLIKMRLEELLLMMYRKEYSQQNTPDSNARYDDAIAGRTLDFLKQNLYHSITLSDITIAIGYGKTYLSNVFKKVYGKSIMDYYTQLKIDEAKFLLREGTMSVAQISDQLGFSSPQYFSKRFSKITHMSPSQYANSVRGAWTTETDS